MPTPVRYVDSYGVVHRVLDLFPGFDTRASNSKDRTTFWKVVVRKGM